jgi:hypothetical protein
VGLGDYSGGHLWVHNEPSAATAATAASAATAATAAEGGREAKAEAEAEAEVEAGGGQSGRAELVDQGAAYDLQHKVRRARSVLFTCAAHAPRDAPTARPAP